jgi:hypothetical protein
MKGGEEVRGKTEYGEEMPDQRGERLKLTSQSNHFACDVCECVCGLSRSGRYR